ncbi:MAG: STAS domain-containing protein [Oscillospiraceae bacterium]
MMNISTAFAAGRLTIYLAGELDHHEARGAIRSIDELLDEYLPRDCVLDMSGLSFMDSSGIALIIRMSRRMKNLGGRAWIENPAKQPLRVIDASGIDRLVPVATVK